MKKFSILSKAFLAALAVASLTLIGGVRASQAGVSLTLSNGSIVTITDGQLGFDLNPNPGAITFVGPVGNFSTTITSGTSNSIGDPSGANLQINSMAFRNTTASLQTLTITFGDTNFTVPGGSSLSLSSSIGGTISNAQVGDQILFQSYADNSNTGSISGGSVTTTGVQTFNVTSPGIIPPFLIASSPASFSAAGAYSLTNKITITLSPNAVANVSGTTYVTAAVPEPASLALLAPVALTLLARRKRSSAR